MPTFYALDIHASEAQGELRINDVPIEIWRDPASTNSIQKVNPWISGADGLLTFVPQQRDPATQRSPAARLRVAVLISNPTQSAEEGLRIAQLDWSPQAYGALNAWTEISAPFASPDYPPSAFWPSAPAIVLDAAARSAILVLLKYLWEALDQCDVEKASLLLDFKAVDAGQSVYMNSGAARANQTKFLSLCKLPGFRMQPLSPEQLTFRLVAKQRLIWVTRPDFSPALQSMSSPRIQIPIYVGVVQGRWTIVR